MKKIIFTFAFGLILYTDGVYFHSLEGMDDKMTHSPLIANGGGLKPYPLIANGGGLKPDPKISNGGGIKPKRPDGVDDKLKALYDKLFA